MKVKKKMLENKKSTLISAFGTGFVIGLILLGCAWLMLSNHSNQLLSVKNDKIAQLQSKLDQVQKQNKKLSDQMKPQPTQVLTDRANKLFSTYYNYDQAKTLNKERQALAKEIANQEVLDTLFPLSADTQKSDYGDISSQLKKSRVYLVAQNGPVMDALVLCDFSTQAGAVSSSQSNEAWAIQYDFNSKRVVKATDLGNLKPF